MKVLWDLDGTIVDTIPSLVETFQIFAEKEYGIVTSLEIVDELTRNSSIDLFAYYNIPYSDENVERFREVNRKIPVSKSPVFDGVEEVLSRTELNVLVTNRNRKSTLEILRFWDLEKYFVDIICADDDFPKKPDSASYEYMKEKYDVNLVIGDRDLDLIPARKLGIKTCLFNNVVDKADYYIKDYKEYLAEM